ncbi:MAG TPA: hypothetical protein VN192_00685 [Flavobacterium sp.]|nr:hypothetical protein [Flavobacterium sp.]
MNSKTKNITKKAINEIKSILLVTLYFATWFGILMLLKKLVLEDYNINFGSITTVIISALIMSKVVLIMQYIEFGQWVKSKPPIVDIIVRTLIYMIGVFIVLIIEKAFEIRQEYGGFDNALTHVFQNRDIYKFETSLIIVGLSIFWFNTFSILTQYYNPKDLINLFFKTPLQEILKKNIKSK